MTLGDVGAVTPARRDRHEDADAVPAESSQRSAPPEGTDVPGPARAWADDARPATALAWVDLAAVAEGSVAPPLDAPAGTDRSAGLLQGARLRPEFLRPRLLVPFGVLVGLAASYSGATLAWPLHELPPTVEAAQVAVAPAPPATVTWPVEGSASVGIAGMGTVASSPAPASIASITKVVSSLMVLDRMPLALGEQGPAFSFDRSDNLDYWAYRRANQSALDVPVGGTLTELQLLQGTLLGSANNYIDRLSAEIWGSDAAFAAAATVWLRDRGIEGITVATPSGFDARNVATPEALVKLGEKAMQNPVFASIVGTASVELPGAGVVTNTNGMLADPGVVGIKTGSLIGHNLLTAKDVTVDGTTVRLYSAVLGQSGDDQRLAATRSLLAEAEAALESQAPAVEAGTVVGEVQTAWGETVDVVTDADAEIVLWNSATAKVASMFDVGEDRESGDEVGVLTATGPLNAVETPLTLAEDLEGPSPWWRLTHPLQLFGLTASQR